MFLCINLVSFSGWVAGSWGQMVIVVVGTEEEYRCIGGYCGCEFGSNGVNLGLVSRLVWRWLWLWSAIGILQNWYRYCMMPWFPTSHSHTILLSTSFANPSPPLSLSLLIIHPSDQTKSSIIKRDSFTLFPEKAFFFFFRQVKKINKIGWFVEKTKAKVEKSGV
ncbi:hypothetical protein B9Z19DRAFT_1072511 [Tuber borchii]|uniref:Transmembrane protein n=1 Tax=Tuber borchii TaxID=42251 RepID=A0A2T7A732_TUBBO|nr:hypothetical protein B9Z19DRAFT_1072511 [Tuber borchii]